MRNQRKGNNRSFKIERKRKRARDESPRHLGNPVESSESDLGETEPLK